MKYFVALILACAVLLPAAPARAITIDEGIPPGAAVGCCIERNPDSSVSGCSDPEPGGACASGEEAAEACNEIVQCAGHFQSCVCYDRSNEPTTCTLRSSDGCSEANRAAGRNGGRCVSVPDLPPGSCRRCAESRAAQVCSGAADRAAALPENPIEFTSRPPRLSIPIPGLPVEFSKLEFQGPEGGRYLLIPWLAQYVVGIVNFLLGIVLLVATVMIVAAGFMWLMAGGAPDKITDAKKRITNAVIGMTLALATYLLLNLINPELTTFKALKIDFVDREKLNTGGDTEGQTNVPSPTIATLAIDCPKTGGAEAIPRIVQSMVGKAAYRYGGKGQAPPYQYENDPYRTFCPEGNLCLDCSGFVDVVYRCAGLTPLPGGSGSIFTSGIGTERIAPGGLDKNANTVNGQPLQVGDLLGWLASDVTAAELAAGRTAVGHVFVYLGNGQIAENTRRNNGRSAGKNPQISNLRDYPFPIRRIRRVTPPGP